MVRMVVNRLVKLSSPATSSSPRQKNSETLRHGATFTRLFCKLAALLTYHPRVSVRKTLLLPKKNWRRRIPPWRDSAILVSTRPSQGSSPPGSARSSVILTSTLKVVRVKLSLTPSTLLGPSAGPAPSLSRREASARPFMSATA